MVLFAPRGVAPIFVKLVVAQAFKRLALASRLLKEFLLLVAQVLQAHQFMLYRLPLLAKGHLAGKCETQFRAAGAGSDIVGLASLEVLQAGIELIEKMAGSRDLLVGGPQAEFVLVLDALPEMKHRLQRKLEGHVSSWAMPAVL